MKQRIPVFLFVALLCAVNMASAQCGDTVYTIAGDTAGFANGQGPAGLFRIPVGVTVDRTGNIYVADWANHAVRKVSPTGLVTTLAGGTEGSADGQGAAAQFEYPNGVAVDDTGNIYVVENFSDRVRKISPTGLVTTLAGSTSGYVDGPDSAAKFNGPSGVAVDGAGNVYIADTDNDRIRKITPDGTVSTVAGDTAGFANGKGTAALFRGPVAVAVDGAGNLYVADFGNHSIRKIDPQGNVTTIGGNGTAGYAEGQDTSARFNGPFSVAVDTAGNVYVADRDNNRIREISPAGMVSTFAGTNSSGNTDGPVAAARFNIPGGVALDGLGNLYVGDESNHRVRRIGDCKKIPTSLAQASGPQAVKVYPNPATDHVQFEMAQTAPGSRLSVTDLTGRLLFDAPADSVRLSLDVSAWPQGLYVWKINREGRVEAFGRFVK